MTKTRWAIEFASLAAVLIAVEWLFTTVTHGSNLPALILVLAIYLAVRLTIVIRRSSGRA